MAVKALHHHFADAHPGLVGRRRRCLSGRRSLRGGGGRGDLGAAGGAEGIGGLAAGRGSGLACGRGGLRLGRAVCRSRGRRRGAGRVRGGGRGLGGGRGGRRGLGDGLERGVAGRLKGSGVHGNSVHGNGARGVTLGLLHRGRRRQLPRGSILGPGLTRGQEERPHQRQSCHRAQGEVGAGLGRPAASAGHGISSAERRRRESG